MFICSDLTNNRKQLVQIKRREYDNYFNDAIPSQAAAVEKIILTKDKYESKGRLQKHSLVVKKPRYGNIVKFKPEDNRSRGVRENMDVYSPTQSRKWKTIV